MDEKYLRAYLLGQLPEFATERLETRALDEEDFFLTLKGVEDDLFDAFARNRLTAVERDAFVRKYGDQHDRLAFAQALANKSSKVVSFTAARRWTAGLAAAAVLVLAVGTMMIRPFDPPTGSGSSRAQSRGDSARDNAGIVQGRPADPTPAATAPAEMTVTASFSIGASRAAETPAAITVPSGATRVELRARLNPADKYETYAIDARSSANNIVWGDAAAKATTVNGDLVVVAMVPASVLTPGSYEIAVRGLSPNARPEELGFATIEIRRVQ